MSTSILYHGFGVRNYRHLRTEFAGGSLIFHIEKSPGKRCCADCRSRDVVLKGRVSRRLRTLPIGGKRVFLQIHLHRLSCRSCGALKLEPLLISDSKRRWTRALGRYVLGLLSCMTIEDVSRHLGMSWDTVKEIHVLALRIRLKRRRLRHLRLIGVDEVAVRKGHNYLTVVVDLETGEVVWVAEGRKTEALEPFLRKLKGAGAKIEAVAMDMWPAYIRAVSTHFGRDVIVFDRYHIMADYNKTLDLIRTTEAAKTGQEDKAIFKGVRYLLLRGSEKIADDWNARRRLDELLAVNETISTAYILKEELRLFWKCRNLEEARTFLSNWLSTAWASRVDLLVRFANKLVRHMYGLLHYFNHRVTTGKVEGINNKIKVLKRQAYGYRDIEYFKLRIYFLHESRYALTG